MSALTGLCTLCHFDLDLLGGGQILRGNAETSGSHLLDCRALIDSTALLDALNSGKIRGAGLDVYEEEGNFFFEDMSDTIIKDDVLALLISRPNVLLTSHQAFLTREALRNIAVTTYENLDAFFAGKPLVNEVKIK